MYMDDGLYYGKMMFNNAKWIAYEGNDDKPWALPEHAAAPLFRKEFPVREKPFSASLKICGLGLYSATLNGKPVTDEVLTPVVSCYDKTVYYNEYDVKSLLVSSLNCIGIVLGNGWYNYPSGYVWDFDKAAWRHHPKLIACLTVKYADGTEEAIVSDTTWKAHCGPVISNFTREGEVYDARLHFDGWNLPGFAAQGWENAFVCRSPGGILKKACFPPIRIINAHNAVHITGSAGGSVYDFGQNMSGWIHISVRGESGAAITIRYAERVAAGGGIDAEGNNSFTNKGRGHCDKYILAGNGETENWRPIFTYHGFRYAEIAVEGNAEVIKAQAHEVHTDLETIASFECGDEMLNKIHHASINSTLSNFHGIPTDCPHREQNGWTGDSCLSAEQALMNFNIAPAYRKWLLDFKDVQRPSGQLPGIIPTSSWGYNWGSGPAWDSALILIPLAVYELTGDISLAGEMWENMERYMEFFGSMADGFLAEFGLGDWCSPENAILPPVLFTDTAYYHTDAVAMEKIARAIGNGRENYYHDLGDKIKKAFRNKFVRDGEVIYRESQTAIACAIYHGLLEESEIPAASKRLSDLVRNKSNHMDCGILGIKSIFSALSENGFAETAYDFTVNPEYPSYAYWIHSGMTTLCEDWEMRQSLNHHMFSEVDFWFYKYLAGIRPGKPGFQTVDIKPCFLDKVKWVKASRKGIEVYWDSEKLILSTPVPARVYIGGTCHEAAPGKHEFHR